MGTEGPDSIEIEYLVSAPDINSMEKAGKNGTGRQKSVFGASNDSSSSGPSNMSLEGYNPKDLKELNVPKCSELA